MKPIDEWWPLLHEQVRRWMVNNLWSPLAEFSLSEIERLGGPSSSDDYWKHRDSEAYLPAEAVKWIAGSSDFKLFSVPKEPDPRAAYFQRGWPRRQP